MSENDRRLREALLKIAEVASAAVQGEDLDEHGDDQASEQASQEDKLACIPKTLPQRLLVKSAETATTINPVNAPVFGPRRLTVSFMESTPANLRARIVSHMNAWTRTASISFVETQGTGNVRISRC